MDVEAGDGRQNAELEQYITALLQCSDPAARIAAAQLLGESGNPEGLPSLLAAFFDPEKEVRAQASAAASMLGTAAVGPLTGMLQAKSWVARYRAIEALSRIGESTTFEPLLQALDDPVDHVRYMSAKALGVMGDPRAFEPLLAALQDENEFVRRSAAIALWKTGGEKARMILTEALRCEERAGVRQTITDILGGQMGR